MTCPDGLCWGWSRSINIWNLCPADCLKFFVGPSLSNLTWLRLPMKFMLWRRTTVHILRPNTNRFTGAWVFNGNLDGDPNKSPLGNFLRIGITCNWSTWTWLHLWNNFVNQDPDFDGCTIEKKLPSLVNELPDRSRYSNYPATWLALLPNGSFEIVMQGENAATVNCSGRQVNIFTICHDRRCWFQFRMYCSKEFTTIEKK